MTRIGLLVSLMVLSACSAREPEPSPPAPAPAAAAAPTPAAPTPTPAEQGAAPSGLKQWVANFAQESDLDEPLHYLAREWRAEDGSGRAVVLLQSREFCGSGGCTMLVLRQTGDGYVQISRNTIVRAPVYLLDTSTNGERDLSVFRAGGGGASYDDRLTFDGSGYVSDEAASFEVPPTARMLIGEADEPEIAPSPAASTPGA